MLEGGSQSVDSGQIFIENVSLFTAEGEFRQSDFLCSAVIEDISDTLYRTSSKHLEAVSDVRVIDGTGMYLVPGLVDIHTHGAMDIDVCYASLEDLDTLSAYYARNGVTSWCPTTMTLSEEVLVPVMETVSDYGRNHPHSGANPLGIYVEGPFFHAGKKGAQPGRYLQSPNLPFYTALKNASHDYISVLAMAPELEGAFPLMQHIMEDDDHVTIALGHSTSNYDTATTAFSIGASLVTHLFNGMNPLTHRSPELIGAAFDKQAYVELICDGLHIHPTVVRMVHKMFGRKLCLITDSIPCAGMPDGEYKLGGQTVYKEHNQARLADGTLAGSSIGLLEGVRKVISFGIPPEDAFYAASAAPACALKKENQVGSLQVGRQADFLLLDGAFRLKETFVGGKSVFQN